MSGRYASNCLASTVLMEYLRLTCACAYLLKEDRQEQCFVTSRRSIAEAPSTFPILSSGQAGQHGLKRLFGVFDTLLSAPTDQAVRAHQHCTSRAYTIGRWPPSINIHEVAASADTPCDQPNTQLVCHLQSGIAPHPAIRTCQ